jgi:ZIP family zinc transporter
MTEGILGAVWAFCWGLAAASGTLVGVILGLITHLRHRAIAAFMSLGAGVLLSAASFRVASEALMLTDTASTVGGIVAGAATFSIANAALAAANDRKRCGECKPQPSEAEAPGSGTSIRLGTTLDAVPEALVLGVTLRAGGPDLALVIALSLANVPEALSGTAGMRLASRSSTYVLILWSGTTLVTAAITALAFYFLSDLPSRDGNPQGIRSRGAHRHDSGKHDPGGLPQWAPLFRRSRRWGVRSPHPSRRTRPVSLVRI